MVLAKDTQNIIQLSSIASYMSHIPTETPSSTHFPHGQDRRYDAILVSAFINSTTCQLNDFIGCDEVRRRQLWSDNVDQRGDPDHRRLAEPLLKISGTVVIQLEFSVEGNAVGIRISEAGKFRACSTHALASLACK